MGTIVSRFILAFWIPCVALASLAQTQGVLLDNMKLRKEPSLKGIQTATLKAHSKVTILNPTPTNGFYHVRASRNREGWIWAKGVRINASSSRSGSHYGRFIPSRSLWFAQKRPIPVIPPKLETGQLWARTNIFGSQTAVQVATKC